MDKSQQANKLETMATTVDSILENAKDLPREDVGELISKLSRLMDDEPLGDHVTLLKTLEHRTNGPFEPLDTLEDRIAMRERVVAKGEALLQKS